MALLYCLLLVFSMSSRYSNTLQNKQEGLASFEYSVAYTLNRSLHGEHGNKNITAKVGQSIQNIWKGRKYIT